MNKLMQGLRAVGMILRHPILLNRVLTEPDHWKKQVQQKHSLGNGLPVIPYEAMLRDGEATASPVTFLDGGSLPTDLALLRILAGWFDGCRYFEIGTWRGESAANVADVATECFTLNLSDDEMRQRGIKEDYIGAHGHFSKGRSNITQLYGNSRDFDFSKLTGKFDLVFIDGDHRYDYVRNDTRRVFDYLTHPGTIVVWHDYGYSPEEPRFEVLAGMLDGMPASAHSSLFHIGQTKCAVYIGPERQGEFSTVPLKHPVVPGHFFEVSLKIKQMNG